MANGTEGKLKLVHLLYLLLLACLAVGIAWGRLSMQQEENCEKIEKKVNTELFEAHVVEQIRQGQRQEKRFDKLDDALERIEKKM